MRFALLAIHILKDKSVGQRKLNTDIYYLRNDFVISDEGDYMSANKEVVMYEDLYSQYTRVHNGVEVNISAIVGENGAGKSTVVEYIIRLLNNYAASTLGEIIRNPNNAHLHYIDGMYGELYFLYDGVPHKLLIRGRNVQLIEYYQKITGGVWLLNEDAPIYDNELQEEDSGPRFFEQEKETRLNAALQDLFYTVVSNYSIYAYNVHDYSSEANSREYEQEIERFYNDTHDIADTTRLNYNLSERHWLTGIFHKNDGYQAPLVLTPYRHEGNIDIGNENQLAKERLLSLVLTPREERINQTEANLYYEGFNVLNDHLEVKQLRLILCEWDDASCVDVLNQYYPELTEETFATAKKWIICAWNNILGCDLCKVEENKFGQNAALCYLAYKTLKISNRYNEYGEISDQYSRTRVFDESLIAKLIEKLYNDTSHVTRKLRRTIAYLVHCRYNVMDEHTFSLHDMREEMICARTEVQHYPKVYEYANQLTDSLPPPFINTIIGLEDKTSGAKVSFNTLSSGERQLAYSVSNILFHILNVDSVANDKNDFRTAYKYVNVILEEIELYFHPNMQKMLLKYLMDGLRQIPLKNVKGVNFIIVTHSPFVLSDIPRYNMLVMDREGHAVTDCPFRSFGANIYDMLKDSFFLQENAIGGYAKYVIDNIVDAMRLRQHPEQNTDVRDYWNQQKVLQHIQLIDEPIIKRLLTEQYNRTYGGKSKAERIAELKAQIKALEEE